MGYFKWAIAGVILLGILAFFFGHIQTGEGKVTDNVMNIETQGIIWKTTELYLTNDHSYFYCIQDANLKTIASSLSDNKSIATIYYHTYIYLFPWECSSGSGNYNNAGIVYQIVEKTNST